MKTLTTAELSQELAGGDSYIRTKNNDVKGVAITIEKNPEAPEIIVVGTGPRIKANAHLLLDSNKYVPVYVKQAVNKWKLLGNYIATKYATDDETIEKHRKHRAREKVDGILFLSPQDDIEVTVKGRSFPDAETRKKVEDAAIGFVIKYFEDIDFQITDRQKDNCGYDLLAQKGKEILKLEVKGTASEEQRFFITRNERAKSADPLWRLVIVSNVSSIPSLDVFSAEEMENQFNFDALSWECKK